MRFKPSRGRLCIRTPFTSVKTNGTPLEILTFQTPPPLSLSTRRRVERNIPGLSCRYHAFIDVYLIARGASYPAPQKYDRSPVVEPIIIPPGFERERDGRGESGLHCYYNETRINTSRLYTRDRCNYLLMMIFVAVGGRGAPGDGGRVGGSQQQPPPPPPQFARPSDKLSEIMSQEIGSLARGWLTAGLPASSLPAALSPSFLKLPFTGLRTRLSRCVPKDRPIDLYTISSNRLPFPLRIPRFFRERFQVSTRFYTIGYVSRLCVYYLSFAWNLLLNFTVFFDPVGGAVAILFVWFLNLLLSTSFLIG